MSRVWYPRPLHGALIELLRKKQGSLTDVDLYDTLCEEYKHLSFITFNQVLLRLEINGLIHVYNLTKNQRGVELIRR